ncbi:MAG: hypothetical protein JRI96_17080 [Deltaproteobacteria bacterium]|nr:hypothetical protein [Deltaproteobacteria bacterium]
MEFLLFASRQILNMENTTLNGKEQSPSQGYSGNYVVLYFDSLFSYLNLESPANNSFHNLSASNKMLTESFSPRPQKATALAVDECG